MRLPQLKPETGSDAPCDGVVLTVYAPFGSDAVLTDYPTNTQQELVQHPLFNALIEVAKQRAHVVALIDLRDDDSYLVEIEAGCVNLRVTSCWKQKMDEPRALAGLLRRAHHNHPHAAIVLALEGHGAGFLPDLDPTQITIQNVTENGKIEWHIDKDGDSVPSNTDGSPTLPMGNPTLPMGNPTLPGIRSVLSTWGIAEALRLAESAGVPKLPVIHFNNCFNLAIEVMHTIAHHAHYATGYANYNFFTAGATYPVVFQKLREAGAMSARDLANLFADENGAMLAAKGNHPTIGGVVRLAIMDEVLKRVRDLADALIAALRSPARPAMITRIKNATERAQQYDTEGTQKLETPDELTDIRSLAIELQREDFKPFKVAAAARALEKVLTGVQRYGASDHPWTAPAETWDFDPVKKRLAMSIFMPDPLLLGVWDWRSPYYLTIDPPPNLPRVQPNIIDFVKSSHWVEFILAYHEGTPFVGLLPPTIPRYPVFNAGYKPGSDGIGGTAPGTTGKPNDPPRRPAGYGSKTSN